MNSLRRSLVLLLVAAGSLRAAAQAPQDALNAVRTRTEITEEDRTLIRQFITERVGPAVGADPAAAREAQRALRTAYVGSDAFKQAYAVACVEVLGAAYKKADVAAAAGLLTTLHTLNAVQTQAAFVEALQDDRVGVRAAAAVGLRGLRGALTKADPQVFAGVMAALKTAGAKEKSRDTLRTVYAALDYTDVAGAPDPRAGAEAIVSLLEERGKLYAAGREIAAFGADDVALGIVERLVRSLTDDQRRRLIPVTATMMRFGIEEYTSPVRKLYDVRDGSGNRTTVEHRNAVERLVLVGEAVLRGLLSPKEPVPNVLESMKKLDTTQMKVQWAKWNDLLKTAVGQDFGLRDEEEPEAKPGDGG